MIIGGLQKLSLCDYPGTPAIVVFLQGCNFNCPFCHNKQLLSMDEDNTQLTVHEILGYLEKRRKSVSAVVISGGEPTLQPELMLLLDAIKTMGYKVKLDTNGSRPGEIGNLIEHKLVDYIAMDIKAPWKKYNLLAGRRVEHSAIKESIICIAGSGITHHFRTTHYTPMLSEDDLNDIRSSLPQTSMHIIQPFKNHTQSASCS